jgi:hypothetical protein
MATMPTNPTPEPKPNRILYAIEDSLAKLGTGLSLKHAKGNGFMLPRQRSVVMGGLCVSSIVATTASVGLFFDTVYSSHPMGWVLTITTGGVLFFSTWLGNLPGTRVITRVIRMGVLITLTYVVSYSSEFISVLPRVSHQLSQKGTQNKVLIYQPLDSLNRSHEATVDSLEHKILLTNQQLQQVIERQGSAGLTGDQRNVLKQQQLALENQQTFLKEQLDETTSRYEARQEDLESRIADQAAVSTPPTTVLDTDSEMLRLEESKDLGRSYQRISVLLLIFAIVSEALWNLFKISEKRSAYDKFLEDLQTDQQRLNDSNRMLLYKQIRLYEQLSEEAFKKKDFEGLRLLSEQIDFLREQLKGE